MALYDTFSTAVLTQSPGRALGWFSLNTELILVVL